MNGTRRGFTLIELVAVLTLIGLLFMVVLPSFVKGTAGTEARLWRDQILRDLRAARAEAVGKTRETSFRFGETSYTLNLGFGEPVLRTLPAGFSLAVEGPAKEGTSGQGGLDGQASPTPSPVAPVPTEDGGGGPEDSGEVVLVFGPNGLCAGAHLVLTTPSGRGFALTVREDGGIAWE